MSQHVQPCCTDELLLNMYLWSFIVSKELKIIQEAEENVNCVAGRKYREEDRVNAYLRALHGMKVKHGLKVSRPIRDVSSTCSRNT